MNNNLLTISKRGKQAPASPVRKLVPFGDAAKAKGRHVYHINIGDPDFTAPAPIISALHEIDAHITRIPYSHSRGLAETVEAWRAYYQNIGITLGEEDVLVTSGGSEGLMMIMATVLDPGDELLVFEPLYANYMAFANFVSAKIVPIALAADTGYHLPPREEVIKHISKRTRAITLINPNNPTGTVFTDGEVRMLLDIAVEHNLFIISDETYYGMTFDGMKSSSILHLATEAEKKNCIVIDSVSKKLNVCGARVGVIVSTNREVMDAVLRFAQGRLSVAYIEQKMVTPMLHDCQTYIAQLAKDYEKRRDAFLLTLENMLQQKLHKPNGAFYAMVPLPVDDVDAFAIWLLTDFHDNNETVMIAPGTGFYATPGKGKHEARVAYVLNEKSLIRAAELLCLGVKEYTKTLQHTR